MTDRPKLRTILRRNDVMRATGYRSTQLTELIAQGEFPKPVKLSDGGRAVGWFEDEVIAWQESRDAAREQAEV